MLLDQVEGAALADFQRAAAAAPPASTHVVLADVGGALCAAVPAHPDFLVGNRVTARGIDGRPLIAAIERIYAQYRARFTVDADWTWLAQRGYTAGTVSDRLIRTSPIEPREVQTPFEIEVVRTGQSAEFGRVCAASSGLPSFFAPWCEALVGRCGWHCFVARHGASAVATAAMYIDGSVAYFGFAATLPAMRGVGAQTALLASRLAYASKRDVETVIATAAVGTDAAPSISHRNLLRAGFEVESTWTTWVSAAPA